MMVYLLLVPIFIFGGLLDCTSPFRKIIKEDLSFSMEGPLNRSDIALTYNIDSLLLPVSMYYAVRFHNMGADTFYMPVNKNFKHFIYADHEVFVREDGERIYSIAESFPNYLLLSVPILPNQTIEFVTSCQIPDQIKAVEISFLVKRKNKNISVYQEFYPNPKRSLTAIEGTFKYKIEQR